MTPLGRPRTLLDRACAECEQTFRPNTRQARFCSMTCYGLSRRGVPRGAYTNPTVKKCPACGIVFETGGAGRPRRQTIFCSAKCAGKPRQPFPREMSDVEVAWLAGVFDGEGSIIAPRPGGLRITISSTTLPLLERVVEVTGTGAVVNHRPATEKHSRSWFWQAHSDNARELLIRMLPLLIVKRERAIHSITKDRSFA